MSNPLHMWKFYSEKYGLATALVEYYPELGSDPVLKHAYGQLRCAEAAIRCRMAELAEKEPE